MSEIKSQAVEMLRDIPDDKVVFIIEILKGLKTLYHINGNDTTNDMESQMALEELKQFRGCVPTDINEKEELAKAREEKYENFS